MPPTELQSIAWKSVFKNRAFRSYAVNKEGRRAKLVAGRKQGFFCFLSSAATARFAGQSTARGAKRFPRENAATFASAKKFPEMFAKQATRKNALL